MKKLLHSSIACLLLFLIFPMKSIAAQNIVNIYNWSGYLPAAVINEFEKQTGIKVNYSTYDSNEALYAKLKSVPQAGYDVIVPSSHMLQRMVKQNMLHPLDKQKLPNFKYLDPALTNRAFDPHNRFSVPYLWGATGIVVNDQYYNPNNITHWSQLWKSKFKNQLMMYNEVRDVFSIALITLGYSINTKDPKKIEQAYQKLKKLYPNIKLFNSAAAENIYIDEDARIGMGWSGDIYQASRRNPHLTFIFPKEGFPLFMDCLAIPKYAPHVNNAYKFINFLLKPKIAAQIAIAEGYSTPNKAAWQYMPKKMLNSPILNPSANILKRGHLELDLGEADELYAYYWQLLKIGG